MSNQGSSSGSGSAWSYEMKSVFHRFTVMTGLALGLNLLLSMILWFVIRPAIAESIDVSAQGVKAAKENTEILRKLLEYRLRESKPDK